MVLRRKLRCRASGLCTGECKHRGGVARQDGDGGDVGQRSGCAVGGVVVERQVSDEGLAGVRVFFEGVVEGTVGYMAFGGLDSGFQGFGIF